MNFQTPIPSLLLLLVVKLSLNGLSNWSQYLIVQCLCQMLAGMFPESLQKSAIKLYQLHNITSEIEKTVRASIVLIR